jgi:hypothetical protein
MGDKTNHPVSLPRIKLDSSGDIVGDADDEMITSMIGAGFQPTFYQFVETMIEVQMAVSFVNEGEEPIIQQSNVAETVTTSYSVRSPLFKRILPKYTKVSTRVTPIDASYTNKYSFTQEGSSTIKTRLMPMPPNPFIQRLLDMKSQAMQQQFEVQLREIELALAREQKAVMDDIVRTELGLPPGAPVPESE